MGGMIQECLLFLVYVEEGDTAASIRKFGDTIGVAKRENIIDISFVRLAYVKILNKKHLELWLFWILGKIGELLNYPEDKAEWLDAENNQRR